MVVARGQPAAAGARGPLPYRPDRSKQQIRRLPWASMSQAVRMRRARVSAWRAVSSHWMKSRRAATVIAWGDTKENVNLVYNGYTATMYTLARIYDISNQFLRHSQGAAEQDVLLRKMDAFCMEQTGMSLLEYAQQLHEEQAQTAELQL